MASATLCTRQSDHSQLTNMPPETTQKIRCKKLFNDSLTMTRAPSTSQRPPISHIFHQNNLDDITLPGSQRMHVFALGKGTEKKTFRWMLKYLPSYSSLRKCILVAAEKFSIGLRTLCHWRKHYQFHDELPSDTRVFCDRLIKRRMLQAWS